MLITGPIGEELKDAPSALLSSISTREFLRTREKCFSHLSSVLNNAQQVLNNGSTMLEEQAFFFLLLS